MCQASNTGASNTGTILVVFRECRECGEPIACLLEGKAPTSCKEHQ